MQWTLGAQPKLRLQLLNFCYHALDDALLHPDKLCWHPSAHCPASATEYASLLA